MKKRRGIIKFEDLPANWEEILVQIASEGGMNVHFQSGLGISRKMYDTWVKENEEFAEAVDEAKKVSEQWWVEKAMNAFEEGKSKMFNQHLWSFIMRNRFPYHWREKTEMDVTTNGKEITNTPIQIEIIKSQDKSES